MTAKQEKLASLVKSATVIPVLTIERLEHAVPLAKALVAGGVRMLEVTLRTPAAIEAAKAMISEVPDAIVGIGTILNPDDLARTEALGAKFGISPGATPELLKAAAASALPFAPGIAAALGRPMRLPGWPNRMCWRLAAPGFARQPISAPATGPAFQPCARGR